MTTYPDLANQIELTKESPFTVLDLEREVIELGASSCEHFIALFTAHIAQLESLQRSGLTPELFAHCEILRSALRSAINCLSLSPSILT